MSVLCYNWTLALSMNMIHCESAALAGLEAWHFRFLLKKDTIQVHN